MGGVDGAAGEQRPGFGTKLAWLADRDRDRDRDVVLIGRDDDDARAAVDLAQAVGITRIGGYLAGGMTSWREERRPVDRITRMRIEQSHDLWSPINDWLFTPSETSSPVKA